MPTSGDDLGVWHLGSTQRGQLGKEPRTFNIGTPVTVDAHESLRADIDFLNEILTRSAFAGLQDRCMDFMRAASNAAQAFEEKQSTLQLTPPIRSSFDNLLSAFVRFVNRTSHSLSQRHGKDSSEAVIFKDATHYEFDHEFAYRFIYHLRNYSDHRGSPISRIKQASKIVLGGKVENEFDVVFDSKILLQGDDWKKVVRDDLQQIDGEFSAIVVVDNLLKSCGRIHCKTLLAQESEIVASISRMRIPIRAPRPAPTISDAGTARPSAHGQAMINTLHTAFAMLPQIVAARS